MEKSQKTIEDLVDELLNLFEDDGDDDDELLNLFKDDGETEIDDGETEIHEVDGETEIYEFDEIVDDFLKILDGDGFTGTFYEMRVHPGFLWSNARRNCACPFRAVTELVKNSVSEICEGATFVTVDILTNEKNGSPMILVADNCRGMDSIRMRHCMSLGYSTHGQDGLGFQTSTMRLGSDVIVFSRCYEQHKSSQCAALLSSNFLSKTGSQSIVVPMLHYEKDGEDWKVVANGDISSIFSWSPFKTKEVFLHQFDLIGPHGTRVIVFNQRMDEAGLPELDLQSRLDIRIRKTEASLKVIEEETTSNTTSSGDRDNLDFEDVLEEEENEDHLLM